MSGSSPEETAKQAAQETKLTAFHYLKRWGDSPLPATGLATLILPLSIQPTIRPVGLIFPPVLLFSSYLNVAGGYEAEAAGINAAWSGLYLLMARRRKHALKERLGVRGGVRALAMALAVGNVVGGGVAWGFGRSKNEEGGEVG